MVKSSYDTMRVSAYVLYMVKVLLRSTVYVWSIYPLFFSFLHHMSPMCLGDNSQYSGDMKTATLMSENVYIYEKISDTWQQWNFTVSSHFKINHFVSSVCFLLNNWILVWILEDMNWSFNISVVKHMKNLGLFDWNITSDSCWNLLCIQFNCMLEKYLSQLSLPIHLM